MSLIMDKLYKNNLSDRIYLSDKQSFHRMICLSDKNTSQNVCVSHKARFERARTEAFRF